MKKLVMMLTVVLLAVSLTVTGAELRKGIDFTGASTFTPSQLNQLVDNAWPATNRGFVYVSNSAPNTVAYPQYTNYLWLDISALPYTLRSYNTGTWASASVGANSVDTGNIVNGAVTNPKLAANAVNTTNISDNAVTDPKIAAGAVLTTKIADLNVTTAKINDLAVTTGKIADGAVTGPKLAPGAVTAAILGAQSVYGTNIVNGTITSNLMALNSVGRTNLQEQSVASTNLVLGSARYQSPRMNVGNTSWEYVQPVYMSATNFTFFSTNTWAHSLPSTPHLVRAYYVVNTSIAGYSTGDLIPLESMQSNETGGTRTIAISASATQIQYTGYNNGGSLYMPNKSTGVFTSVATSSMNGQIRIVAVYYNQATEN